MGKSGHIARKIASTLASTGTPAYFVHPGRGEPRRPRHGRGRRRVHRHLVFRRERGAAADRAAGEAPRRQLIAITGKQAPTLALARPTCTSTPGWSRKPARSTSRPPPAPRRPRARRRARGGAARCARLLATTTSRARIPAASCGARRWCTWRRDAPRRGCGPRAAARAPCRGVMREMSRGGIGMTAVVDDAQRCIGIFTDGDLRRALEKGPTVKGARIEQVMRRPRTIRAEALAVEAAADGKAQDQPAAGGRRARRADRCVEHARSLPCEGEC